MKKKCCLIILLVLILLPISGGFFRLANEATADEYGYSYACGLEYEVDYIEDDGRFKKVGCYSELAAAKKKMSENNDYVVRHYAAYSPTKIIAMNSGLAYSYPARSASSTMNFYSKVPVKNVSYKTTYVANHYEMTYIDTERYLTSHDYIGMGIVEIVLNGFHGYTDLENVDLVPTKFIEKAIPIYLGGKDKTASNEAAFKVICHYSYFSVNNNHNLIFNYYRAYSSAADFQPYSSSFVFGPAPEFMEEGRRYYSNDGINYYNDGQLSDFVGTYYNYYQYLPLRSKTSVSASEFDSFLTSIKGADTKSVLKNKGSVFIDNQNRYGVNALLVYAMACHEAAYGTSALALNRNNLFGYAAFDASPSSAYSYNSIEQCVSEHMGYNLRWYLDIESTKFFSSSLGDKGSGLNVKYASDPYWGMKIAGTAYMIDKYAGFKDFNNYNLAIMNDDSQFYYHGEPVYQSSYGDDYQLNFFVIANEFKDDYTTIQFTNPIAPDGVIVAKNSNHVAGLVEYNFEKSQLQVLTTDLQLINCEYEISSSEPAEGFVSIRKLALEDNILKISGIGLIKGRDFTNSAEVSHYLELSDYHNEMVYSFCCEILSSDGFSLNDGSDYSYTTYQLSLDVSQLNIGNYLLNLRICHGDEQLVLPLSTSNSAYAFMYNDFCRVSTDELYQYRLCLDVGNDGLDYSLVNKPSTRKSLFSFDSIEISDDLQLTINGHGLIYYVDFVDDVSFEAYLVRYGESPLKMSVESAACPVDYARYLNSDYILDGICFKASADIAALKGEYKLYLLIKSGSYVDIIEMANHSWRKIPIKETEQSIYAIMTSEVRDHLYLKVE